MLQLLASVSPHLQDVQHLLSYHSPSVSKILSRSKTLPVERMKGKLMMKHTCKMVISPVEVQISFNKDGHTIQHSSIKLNSEFFFKSIYLLVD